MRISKKISTLNRYLSIYIGKDFTKILDVSSNEYALLCLIYQKFTKLSSMSPMDSEYHKLKESTKMDLSLQNQKWQKWIQKIGLLKISMIFFK